MICKQIYLTHKWDLNKYTTTQAQGGSRSNGYEGLLYTPQSSRTGVPPPDAV